MWWQYLIEFLARLGLSRLPTEKKDMRDKRKQARRLVEDYVQALESNSYDYANDILNDLKRMQREP